MPARPWRDSSNPASAWGDFTADKAIFREAGMDSVKAAFYAMRLTANLTAGGGAVTY
jgi:hypothetical protein